ncbi:MAG: hypothetical protein VST66_11695, partial [Nitrospirota bacterium]|nr:hypothetical protein [Nitrospirota bacterium]
LKTGAPVIPASIAWNKARPLSLVRSLLTPGKALVQYGAPIVLPAVGPPEREKISLATDRIMRAIRDLRSPEAYTPR